MKLKKPELKEYFNMLVKNIGDQFKKAATASEDCFEDIWYETDFNETGYVTWH